MSRVGFIVSKVKIKVLIMNCKVRFLIILGKLFLRRYLIYFKLNSLLVTIYSLILNSVYSIDLSSYNILKSNYRTVTYLSFLTHTL